MSEYQSNVTLQAAAARLLESEKVLLTTHAKPDADALGSVIALATALRHRGKQVDAVVMGPVVEGLAKMRGMEGVREYVEGEAIPVCDRVVVVDTGAWAQLKPMQRELEPTVDRMLVIDHHLSGDVPAADLWIDPSAAACCEMLGELLEAMPDRDDLADPIIGEALFAGLAADTGWFRFSNTRPQTHELAARLIRAGVDHAELYGRLEQSDRIEKISLLTRALSSLERLADDRVALMVLRASDFEETGALPEETEHIVDIPRMVGAVQAVVLITEPPAIHGQPGAIRLSFRSKPGAAAVNVADIAKQFGGGGHARAAGAKVEGELDAVVAKVRAAFAGGG